MYKLEKHITEEGDLVTVLLNAAKKRIRKLEQENYKLSTKKEQDEKERSETRERDLENTHVMMRCMLSKLKSVLEEEKEKMMEDKYCWMNRLEHRVDIVEKLENARNEKLLQDLKERDEIIEKMKLQLAKLKKDEDTEKNKKRKRDEGRTEEKMNTRGEEENRKDDDDEKKKVELEEDAIIVDSPMSF